MTSTTRTYVLTMTKPHEQFGLPQSLGKQIAEHATLLWYALIWMMIIGLSLTYIGFVTTSSTRGFQLRDAERRVERLRSDARSLEMDVAKLTSVHAMSSQAMELGFVAVNRIETVNAAEHSYAFAR